MSKFYERLEALPSGKWREVATWYMAGGAVVTAFVLTCMFFNFPPKLGGLAWAQDIEDEVTEQMKPVTEKVESLEKAVNEQTAISKILLGKVASDKLIALLRRRCHTHDTDEKVYLTEEIRKYKEDYKVATGNNYEEPSCDQLGYSVNRG